MDRLSLPFSFSVCEEETRSPFHLVPIPFKVFHAPNRKRSKLAAAELLELRSLGSWQLTIMNTSTRYSRNGTRSSGSSSMRIDITWETHFMHVPNVTWLSGSTEDFRRLSKNVCPCCSSERAVNPKSICYPRGGTSSSNFKIRSSSRFEFSYQSFPRTRCTFHPKFFKSSGRMTSLSQGSE